MPFKAISIFSGILALVAILAFAAPEAEKPFSVAALRGENKAGETELTVQVRIAPTAKLYAERFAVEVQKPLKLIPLILAVPRREKDAFSGQAEDYYQQSFTNVYLVENFSKGGLEVNVRFQGCDATTCFLPASEKFVLHAAKLQSLANDSGVIDAGTDVTAPWLLWLRQNYRPAAAHSGYAGRSEFSAFLNMKRTGPALVQKMWQMGRLWITVLLIIAGGLLLNLTPCVLPLIPVNLAIIGAGVKAGSAVRGFARGGTYGAGIALAYGALGLISVLTGAQFGAINASPWFNIGVAALFIVLGLALLDVMAIDLTRFQGRLPTQINGTLVIVFLGAVSALLAGACVAPVVIAVLLLAADLYAKGQFIGILLPFLLGIGMALPWPFAGAGFSFLPKPGKWMLKVKYFFAVVILLTAGYYLFVGGKLIYNRQAARGDARAEEGWINISDDLIIENNEKPGLIYFWASWCKTCAAMSATTLRDEGIRAEMRAFTCLKFQAENPDDPAVRRVLNEFGVKGLPTFVILERIKPEVGDQRSEISLTSDL